MKPSSALEGLKTALQTELNGVEFYRIAAQKTDDVKGRRTFQMLADDELKHFEALQQEYISLVKNSGWKKIELGDLPDFDHESPIFSPELKARIKDRHFEMTALSIGALLESNSIDFYRRMKDESSDPAARELYGHLQRWEESHLEAITRQLDLLKEEYWAEQRFSPLF